MIWLIGNKGMLGKELANLIKKAGISYTGTDKNVDITDPKALNGFIKKNKRRFKWIINCAAYTSVDLAEGEKDSCRLLNTDGPGYIAHEANEINARMIHISTDYVFSGNGNRPYTEEDDTEPACVYGITKRDGELRVLQENKNSYIIRTAWLYGKYGHNFVHTMLRLMKERDNISVVNDQRGNPTWTGDLAAAIVTLICQAEDGKEIPYGIYHYANEGETTWFDFAFQIYANGINLGLLSKDCKIIPCDSSGYSSRVKRPAYSVLDKTKIKNTLGISIPVWEVGLGKYFADILIK